MLSKEIILSEVSPGGSPIMSATLVLDEKYNNQKPGLCSDSGFPQIADNSDTSCLGIGGRRLSAFDLIYCDLIQSSWASFVFVPSIYCYSSFAFFTLYLKILWHNPGPVLYFVL